MHVVSALQLVTYASNGTVVVTSSLERTLCAGPWRGDRCPVINLAGRDGDVAPPYDRHVTKVELFGDFLKKSPPDQLVAFADGTDVVWGGCGLDRRFVPPAEQVAELGRRVRKILARTRKTVLFGAEIGSFGNEDLDIPGPSESDLESCPDTFAAHQYRIKYLNSGVVFGTARSLLPAVEWVLQQFRLGNFTYDFPTIFRWNEKNDQPAFATYWSEHTDEVTIDFCAETVVNLNSMNVRFALARGALVALNTNQSVCLVHGNGGDYEKATASALAAGLTNYSTDQGDDAPVFLARHRRHLWRTRHSGSKKLARLLARAAATESNGLSSLDAPGASDRHRSST